jgi:AcrR family transcriptional regulator
VAGVVSRSRRSRAGEQAPRGGRARNGRVLGAGSTRVERAAVVDGQADVVRLQRARIVAAMVEVVAERGVARSTVAHVVARSGVSRRTFYELFEDREDCFLAAFDLMIERAAARVVAAFEKGEGWLGRVRCGLRALLEFLDDEPSLGRLGVVDALGAGPVALERRTRVVGVMIDVVDEGRRERKAGRRLTRLTAEGIVGAVLAVLHARLVEPEREPMVGLLGPLMGLIVVPYEGRAVAEREAAQPKSRRRPAARPAADPLLDLEMRLTYRTVRVLIAIAGVPGASNRGVADASGVSDQGQISKLLARLEHLGLIANVGEGHARGEPNAWQLTPKGRDVEQTLNRRQGEPSAR